MTVAFYLLLLAGHLGFVDVLYFHIHRCRLAERPECQREVLWHTLRHAIYGAQFLIVANLRFHGGALLGLAALYAADVFVALADVLEEKASRRPQDGLPSGEYLMHIVLSLLIGAYLLSVGLAVWPDRLLPAAVVIDPPPVPALLRGYMTAMGIGAFAFFAHDLRRLLRFRVRAGGAAGAVHAGSA
jgi:hypothetical protein